MNDEEIFSAYILNTRTQYRSPEAKEVYEMLFHYLDETLKRWDVDCTYALSFSKHRLCENISYNGANCIIYDQYLGQTISMLNRILLENKPFGATFSYSHKLIGEYFSRFSHYKLAATCGAVYSRERDLLTSDGSAEMKRKIYSVVQEFYILAHEGYHLLLKKNASIKEEADHNVDVYLNNRIDRVAKVFSIDPDKRNLLYSKEHLNQWYNEDKALRDRLNQNDYFFLNNEIETIEALKGNSSLREEISCDYYAASLTVNVCTFALKLDFFEILEAIYIAMYHLRGIRFLELGCLEFIKNRDQDNFTETLYGDSEERYISLIKSNEFSFLQIRSQVMLQRSLDLFDLYLGESSKFSSLVQYKNKEFLNKHTFHDNLLHLQEMHYQIITEPIEKIVRSGLFGNKLVKEAIRRKNNDSKFKNVLDAIDNCQKSTPELTSLLIDGIFGPLPSNNSLEYYRF